MAEYQHDLYFFVCIFISLMFGRSLGIMIGYRNRMKEETSTEEGLLLINVIQKTENGISVFYDMKTGNFIRSGITAEELVEYLSAKHNGREVRLIISMNND